MATARKIVPEYRIGLELSQAEAEVLFFVLRQIGGSPGKSPRGRTTAIMEALEEAGVSALVFDTSITKDSIIFMDSP